MRSERADGRPVMVCAADMPFVTAELIREIADADPAGAPAVVAWRRRHASAAAGLLCPEAREGWPARCCARPGRRAAARGAGRRAGARGRLTEAVAELGPRLYEVADPDALFNVNSPEDLLVGRGDRLDRPKAA